MFIMNLKKRLIIAIDGHASCGKSTLAKSLAKALKYKYIDTGAMYRAVTLYAIRKSFINNKKIDVKALLQDLYNLKIDFVYNSQTEKNETYLNGENVENLIRGLEVSQYVSEIAAIPEVRKYLVALQQEMGREGGVVMDGRDIGTVVFPNADLKIFLTAKPEVRAKRRYLELKAKGQEVDYQDILQNVLKRDKIDSTREASPLQIAEDAIYFDNSNITIEEQFQMFLTLIKVRFGKK